MYSAASKRMVLLDGEKKSPAAERFDAALRARMVGQDRAVRAIVSAYQVFQAGMNNDSRPLVTMLFLGPTGSGKTHLVEAAAETAFGTASALVKIDCAEFQHDHEIAKLIGSPPGYLGHRETKPLLSQETLDRFHDRGERFTLVLFDEIEKASDALWKLLLGILDKATLTLGDNRRVDFSQTMVILTSNLGARAMTAAVSDSLGFTAGRPTLAPGEDFDRKIYRTAMEAARRHFSPEFMNRLDKVVAFRGLKTDELRKILDLELAAVAARISDSQWPGFSFDLSLQAKQFLLDRGTDYRYGARHLKRKIESYLVHPLSNLMATGQIGAGEVVFVDVSDRRASFDFFLEREPATISDAAILPLITCANAPSQGFAATL